jgi:DNA-binding SARP family transcriptional activator/predicted ATPase
MVDLHIYLLGDFRLSYGDESLLVIAQSRHQALLTYLLLHRQAPQIRRHLAFLLWPNSSEAQALTNLRKALTHLRQMAPLLAQAIYVDHQVVQWRPPFACTLDVTAFEAQLNQATAAEQAGKTSAALTLWAAAVALYTGPLTPSCYDDWIMAERERLHQLCLGALERLVAGHERQQQVAAAIPYAQQMLRLDPLQETLYLQLMRLQALQGDRASALRTYHTCATVLARELGVEPAPETQAAYARLLNLAQGAKAATRPPSASRLVGRQAEWEKLQRAWWLASTQAAHFVCLWGEAGIGKTHLAEELLSWAGQQGFTVARTRAYAGEGQLAYAPVVEWLRAEAVHTVRPRLAPVWLSEVARLAPEILTDHPAVPAPAPMTERWQRQRLWEALARALLAAAQPMLLVIDDLQWCDTETLEWLRYLLHFAPEARLLVLGTARPEEVDAAHPLQTLCCHLRSVEQLTELELGPLNAEQSAVLAAQVAQQPLADQAQEMLYRATAGNPLFIVEMVRARVQERGEYWRREGVALPHVSTPAAPLPPKMQAVIQSRLAHLSPTTRDLAQVAAVVGQDFTFELILHASGQDEDALARGLDELWQRRIIREQGAAYDFSHDRIRDVAYGEISPIRRRQLHRQIAVALEQLPKTNLDPVSSTLAFHFERADLFEQAVHYYQQAGRVAQQCYAYPEAALYLQRGLTLLRSLPALSQAKEQELNLLITLGAILSEVKGLAAPEVGEIYGQAFTLCQRIGNQGQLYIIQAGLAAYYGNRGEWKVTHKLAKDNLALAQVLHDPTKMQHAHHRLGLVCLSIGMFSQALEHFEQAIRMPTLRRLRSDQDGAGLGISMSCVQAALCLWLLGYPDQAYQRIQEVPTLNQLAQPPTAIAVNLYFSLVLYHLLQDSHTMVQLAEEMIAVATKYNLVLLEADAAVHAGFARACQGEAALGIAQIRQGLAYYRSVEERMYVPYALAYLIEIYAQLGQIGAAQEALNEAISMTEQTGEYFWYAELLRLRGEILLAAGAAACDVEPWYQQARQQARQQQAKSFELRAAMSLARLWQQQKRSAEAYQLLAEVYSWFTEGFDTADLREAKALLAELGRSS